MRELFTRSTVAALALWSAGCTPPPPPAPPPSYVPPTVAPPPAEEESPPEPSDSRVVEIEPQGAASQPPRSLVEAAEAEQRRRRGGGETPIAVITNDNLEQLGEGIELTYVEDEEGLPAEAAGAVDERAEAEAYWRDRIYEARLAWRDAVELKADLEERAALLRRRFYSEDDPFVRDGQIKPEWDRVLDRLRQTEADILRHREEVDTLLAEARSADAEPGWLDAGAELEPELDAPEADDELPAHEIKDPPTTDGGGR